LNDITETSIWHQAFDKTLSRHPIMNVSNITSVPALNALLTSSYLYPAGGMMAHTDATPTSLLLFHIKEGTVIRTATHKPSLLLLYVHDDPAIMTALNAQNLLLFFFQNNPAITISSLMLPLCQDNSAIMMATNSISLLLFYVHDNPAIMTAMHASLLLPYVWDDPAIMTATHAKLILTRQLIVVFTQGVLTVQHNFHGTLSNSEGVCASTNNFNVSKTSLHFCQDFGIFCEGEW
jgi:hypothetical protein